METKTKEELKVGFGIGLQEIGAGKLLLLVKVFARLLAGLLSPGFVKRFWQRLWWGQKPKAISIIAIIAPEYD